MLYHSWSCGSRLALTRMLVSVAVVGASLLSASQAWAGGGGENMLLVVNPKDEWAVRVANAYVQARNIPTSNIVYITPTTTFGYSPLTTDANSFVSQFQTPILNAISNRGLANQIDYIGTIGEPQIINYGLTYNNSVSFNYALDQMTQYKTSIAAGNTVATALGNSVGASSAIYQQDWTYTYTNSTLNYTLNYTQGSNPAIHHSTVQADGSQWYMSGTIGYAGMNGLTTSQVIANLQRTVAADGTKPQGKIYFEDNSDVRSTTRDVYWPSAEQYMTAHNIPWVYEDNVSGATPTNRTNVRGAVIGSAFEKLPNGSTYLPGSYVDNLTSSGSQYYDAGPGAQTLAGVHLAVGAGGTAGTVIEPSANANRFTNPAVFIYQNDGSTLGESFYKSVATPDLQMFQGDLLSQAYADVPTVSLTSGPANNATVSGTVSIGATASLVNPSEATGISKLELFVDGKDTGQSVSAASGSFNLNTTGLSDGVHQIRVVAYNNTQAASEGYALSNLVVDNKGQSVSISGSPSYTVAYNQSLQVPVSAASGSGGSTVSSIQLQELGRVVGTVNGSSGNVALNAANLAYGSNTITPVAILSDGSKVQGQSITVTRNFNELSGAAVTPATYRNPGFTFEYFSNAAGHTIADTNFSGTPNYTLHGTNLQIVPDNSNIAVSNIPSAYRFSAGGSNKGMAVRITGSFDVTTPGEYSFSFSSPNTYFDWTSFALQIDGQTISNYDWWNGTTFNNQNFDINTIFDTARSAYLLDGQHTLTVLLANYSGSWNNNDANSRFYLQWQGAVPGYDPSNSNTNILASSANFYTVVPEPVSGLLLLLCSAGVLLNRATASTRNRAQ